MMTVQSALPWWDVTQASLQDALEEVASGSGALAFSHVTRIAEIAGKRNLHQTAQQACGEVKQELVQLEERHDAGHVKLSQEGAWALDSTGYLRQLGALDESRPAQPSLIVPNFLHANCLNASSFYDACCKDECEGLLDRLEEVVKTPRAKPGEVLRAVAALPSSSMPAPRTLANSLVQQLAEVTERHGGEVPLRGRLFSKWMHSAYPRECPYPQGRETKHLLSRQWLEEVGLKHWLDENTTQLQTRRSKGKHAARAGASMARSVMRACAFLAVVVVSLLAMRSTVQKMVEALAITSKMVSPGKACTD